MGALEDWFSQTFLSSQVALGKFVLGYQVLHNIC